MLIKRHTLFALWITFCKCVFYVRFWSTITTRYLADVYFLSRTFSRVSLPTAVWFLYLLKRTIMILLRLSLKPSFTHQVSTLKNILHSRGGLAHPRCGLLLMTMNANNLIGRVSWMHIMWSMESSRLKTVGVTSPLFDNVSSLSTKASRTNTFFPGPP